MPLDRTIPNYYSDSSVRPTGSTGVSAVDFGFPASTLRLYNPSGVDMFINPASTTICTTDDICIRACSELTLTDVDVSVVTLYATSTGASIQAFTLSALGG